MSKQSQGLTLIELLMVLLLSSVIIEGVFSMYLRMEEHYRYHQAQQEIIEEIRFVNQLLNRAIQGAGYLGLSNWDRVPVYDNFYQHTVDKSILILDSDDERLPENVRKKITPETQALEVRQMDFSLAGLVKEVRLGESEIIADSHTIDHWKLNQKIVIADNEHAEINQVIAVRTISAYQHVLALKEPLHDNYGKNAYIGVYLDKIYFIGDTGNFFSDKEKINGLYMYSENGMTEEITDLMSTMSVQWLQEKTIRISTMFMLPHWVNGKLFSHQEEFVIACRE